MQNILSNEQQQSPISLASFIHHWQHYKAQIRSIAPLMYGTSAMLAGLQQVNDVFEQENQQHRYGIKILIIVSDGQATQDSHTEIIDAIAAMQQNNIVVISLYLSISAEIQAKCIYAQADEQWSAPTQLMFECASYMSQDSFLFSYLQGTCLDNPPLWKIINAN